MHRWFFGAVLLAAPPPTVELEPLIQTQSAEAEVDDPAIWVNRAHPERSLIVGTIKAAKPLGGLAVYSLEGLILALAGGIDRPNNVDILDDLCGTTERLASTIRLYRAGAAAPYLTPLGSFPVFEGESGARAAPMGIALWRRPRDRALFAFVSRKSGPPEGYLWQYRLAVDRGRVSATLVRKFGSYSGTGEIEAIAVDHRADLVYYSDENCCVRVWRADPDSPDASREVDRFASTGFGGNREGIAITENHVIVTDQLAPRSEYRVFRRLDRAPAGVWRGHAESTDGIEAVSAPLGPRFPDGLLVVMNNARRNFHFHALPGARPLSVPVPPVPAR